MGKAGQTGSRFHRFSAWLSQGTNLLLFNGSPDETISGRAWRQGHLQGHEGWSRARRVIDRLFFWDPDHCMNSHRQDLKFARFILNVYREMYYECGKCVGIDAFSNTQVYDDRKSAGEPGGDPGGVVGVEDQKRPG